MESTQDPPPDQVETSRGSALVAAVFKLNDGQRGRLGISDLQLHVADLLFRVCVLLVDDSDSRLLLDRLQDVEDMVNQLDDLGLSEAIASSWPDEGPTVPPWVRRASTPGYRRFVQRFVGAAHYDRLTAALRADGAILVVAVRRGLRYLLPLAAALDRCIRTLSPIQQSQIGGIEAIANSSLLEIAVKLDTTLDKWLEESPVLDTGAARPDELEALPGGMGEIARSMSERVTLETARLIDDLSATLARKVQGARDALAYSSDPVSQGANSMIELIDRLLRDAFSPDYVVAWVTKWYPERDGLLFERANGALAPTKRAQALCFAFAGGDVNEHSVVHELAAASLTSIRDNLQRLKHADTGSAQEQTELQEWIVAVESTILLICKFAWLGAGEASLGRLREGLSVASVKATLGPAAA